MNWEYRRFKSYGEFVVFLNKVTETTNWNLHSWQDIRDQRYDKHSDIRAIFAQMIYPSGSGAVMGKLPEA